MAPAGFTTTTTDVLKKKLCDSELDVAWLLEALSQRCDDLSERLSNHPVADVSEVHSVS